MPPHNPRHPMSPQSSHNEGVSPASIQSTGLDGPARKTSIPEWLGLGVVVLAAALSMSPNTVDPDLWGHVQFGREVLQSGQIPSTTSYSYTADGFRWINHENLSEVVMALTVKHFGPLGLIFGKLALSLLLIGIVLAVNLRQGTGSIVAAITTLLVASNLGYHWSFRPQLSTFVCYTLLLLVLQFAFQGWQTRWHLPWPRRWFADESIASSALSDSIQPANTAPVLRLRWLWLLIPLFAIWTNAHGGFIAGIAILGGYLGCRGVEILFRKKTAGLKIIGYLTLTGVLIAGTTLLNPYGIGLHRWLLESLGQARPEISDWSNRELFTLVGMKLWALIAIALLAITFSRRRLDATHLIILGLTLWQSISHFRHVPFFALACGFWIGPHLQSAMARLATSKSTRPVSRWGQIAVSVALLLAMVLIGYRLNTRLHEIEVRRADYPVDAIQFMRENDLHGRLVVTYDWAQYAIGALCSEEFNQSRRSRVAFDGRFRTCYPQPIVDMHFDFLYGATSGVQRQRSVESPPIDPHRVLKHLQPDLVLLRRSGELTEQHMQSQRQDWALLYQDATAQLWGLRVCYDNPQHPQYLSPPQRLIHDRLATDSVAWPAITTRPPLHSVLSFSTGDSTHPSLTLLQGTR